MTTAPLADGVVTFADGLPGFEECREFVILASPELHPFAVLQGIGEHGPSFVAIDPRVVEPAYETTLDGTARRRISAEAGAPLLWLAIVAAEPDGSATANLRAPVVINPGTMQGVQVISVDSPYQIAHPLEAA
jgi:flagellar assembly factor FliW